MLSSNLSNGRKPWGSSWKKYGILWRESPIFRWFSCSSERNERWYAAIYQDMELEMDFITSRILLQKTSTYNYQFCTKACVSSRLVSQVQVMTKAKYKGKVPDMSDFNQNVETTCNSKLNFIELEDLFIKRVQKI